MTDRLGSEKSGTEDVILRKKLQQWGDEAEAKFFFGQKQRWEGRGLNWILDLSEIMMFRK